MDVWWWITLLMLLVLIGVVMLARRSARTRVDPTQLSIDPALVARVRELCAQGKRLQAVTELRAATGLRAADAVVIVDKLGKSGGRGAGRPGPD